MSVELSDDEAWAFLEAGHTGILTSLRADGAPVSLPVWYVVTDRVIFVRTPDASKKVARISKDDRVCFLVEQGEAWRELQAVVVTGRAELVDDEPVRSEVDRLLAAKYRRFREPAGALPKATKRHYSVPRVVIRITMTDPMITWDNRKLRLR